MTKKKNCKLSQQDISVIEAELNRDNRIEIAPGKDDEVKVYCISRRLIGANEKSRRAASNAYMNSPPPKC